MRKQTTSDKIAAYVVSFLLVAGGFWAWHRYVDGPNLSGVCTAWAALKSDETTAVRMGSIVSLEMNSQLLTDIHNVKVAANGSGDQDVIAAGNAFPSQGATNELNSACS